jgi:hypothetical protein
MSRPADDIPLGDDAIDVVAVAEDDEGTNRPNPHLLSDVQDR